MNITFLQDKPLNTVIVNSTDGRPLYEIHTPWKFGSRTTSIRRTHPETATTHGEIVAEVDWHAWGSSQISFLGSSMMPLDDFLRQSSIWSRSRTITGNDGRLYKWRTQSNTLMLSDVQSNATVAQSHGSRGGWFSTPRKMNLDIHPGGMQTLDTIIVSFIIMEEKRRQRGASAAGAGSMAGS